MIEIKCSTKDTLNLSEITEFQGSLKERDSTDYEKIERSIRKHGFSFPFFIWRHDGVNHCLDGHGRLGTLQKSQVFRPGSELCREWWQAVNRFRRFQLYT